MSDPDKRRVHVAENTDEEHFPGERLIVCCNPLLAYLFGAGIFATLAQLLLTRAFAGGALARMSVI